MNLNKKLLFLVVYTFHKKDLQKTTFGGLGKVFDSYLVKPLWSQIHRFRG
jgi:hypothetical protein